MDDRRLLMLEIGLWKKGGVLASAAEGLDRLDANPTIRDEIQEVLVYQLGKSSRSRRRSRSVCLPADTACVVHARRSTCRSGTLESQQTA